MKKQNGNIEETSACEISAFFLSVASFVSHNIGHCECNKWRLLVSNSNVLISRLNKQSRGVIADYVQVACSSFQMSAHCSLSIFKYLNPFFVQLFSSFGGIIVSKLSKTFLNVLLPQVNKYNLRFLFLKVPDIEHGLQRKFNCFLEFLC